jgi:hypothetical protein
VRQTACASCSATASSRSSMARWWRCK